MIATMTELETVKEIRTAIRKARYVYVTINPRTGTIARISKAEAVHLLRDYEQTDGDTVEWRMIADSIYIDPAGADD